MTCGSESQSACRALRTRTKFEQLLKINIVGGIAINTGTSSIIGKTKDFMKMGFLGAVSVKRARMDLNPSLTC